MTIPSDKTISRMEIMASQVLEKVLLSAWQMDGVHMGVDGLVCDADSSGEAISPDFMLGLFDKDIYVAPFKLLPAGTSIDMYYQIDDADWAIIPGDGIIRNVRGIMRLKAVLTASKYEWPVFMGVNVAVSLSA
jgi:hypothetical protein